MFDLLRQCMQVGIMEVGSQDVAKTGLKGKGLKLLHVYGDQLWSLGGSKAAPDPSFTLQRIFPLQALASSSCMHAYVLPWKPATCIVWRLSAYFVPRCRLHQRQKTKKAQQMQLQRVWGRCMCQPMLQRKMELTDRQQLTLARPQQQRSMTARSMGLPVMRLLMRVLLQRRLRTTMTRS